MRARGAGKATRPRKAGQWTAARRKRFLTVLAQTANVTRAAAALKITTTTAYKERKRNASFAKAWDEALEAALDDLEAALLDRAVHGVEQPRFFGGKACGTVRHYSDAAAMFILRARRPERYGKSVVEPCMTEEPAERGDADARAAIEAELDRLAASEGEAGPNDASE
jgi:hypothetical protein